MASLRSWLRTLPRALLERFLEGQRYMAIEEGISPTLWMAPRRVDEGLRDASEKDELTLPGAPVAPPSR